MYLMYVDESGDVGMSVHSPTRYFVLTGLVVHERDWQPSLDQIIAFRQRLQKRLGLRLREEVHASALINTPGDLVRIKKNDRMTILRNYADELATVPRINLINVVVDKSGKAVSYDPFYMAWKVLIQRFNDTLIHGNFPSSADPNEHGMIFPDHTDDKKLTLLLRKMRRYNPISNQPHYGAGYRDRPIRAIVEDPMLLNSAHSYFIQSADVAAYLLYQSLQPNKYMQRGGGQNYFTRLDPIVCKVAAPRDPQGIVRL